MSAALWTSAAVLAVFETVAAFRIPARAVQRVFQVLVGSALGAGVLLVRLLLH